MFAEYRIVIVYKLVVYAASCMLYILDTFFQMQFNISKTQKFCPYDTVLE